MNWLSRMSKAGTDGLVGIASGTTPIKALDESRIAIRIIVAVAVVTFTASGWLVWQTISTAAKLPPLPNQNKKEISTALAALQSKDTDGDSLSDYDELYSYNSSPYLFSSAGDNVSDGQKVKDGVNPNCRTDEACGVPTVITTSSATSDSGTVSTEFLRQALKAAGVPAATVDAADDTTIKRMYNEALDTSRTTNTNGSTNINGVVTNTSGNTNSLVIEESPTLSSLQNMTGAQIRALLLGNGIDETLLSQLDDATLKTIFQEAVTNNTTQ